MNRRLPVAGILVALLALSLLCVGADKSDSKPSDAGAGKWQSLFDGKSLGKWKPTEFGGQGESTVDNGTLLLTHGEPLTGVTWDGAPPMHMNYEIELDAQRVDGSDFFCGLTVPVDKANCSLIIGGWGGALCGISNLDDNDAANNETTKLHEFKNKQWYHIRLRVEPEKMQAWIDDEADRQREHERQEDRHPLRSGTQQATRYRVLSKLRRSQEHPMAIARPGVEAAR